MEQGGGEMARSTDIGRKQKGGGMGKWEKIWNTQKRKECLRFHLHLAYIINGANTVSVDSVQPPKYAA